MIPPNARTAKNRKRFDCNIQSSTFISRALEIFEDKRDNPSMPSTIIDKKRRTTLPECICDAIGLRPNDRVEWRIEEGELRGRKLVIQVQREVFPRGSLRKYLTLERDQEQLSILAGCVTGPISSSK
jgi:hypothetical protein